MKKFFSWAKPSLLLLCLVLGLSSPSQVLAASGDLTLSSASVWFSNDYFFEGSPTRIWASIQNSSGNDLLGTVRFTSKDGVIQADQPISVLAGKTDEVFVDWTPPSYGTYTITVTVIPWDGSSDNPANNVVQKNVSVQQDTDHDGLPNSTDPDKDGDGVNNEEDAFPISSSESKDSDGDGQGNNKDTDDDNDGTLDSEDQMPEDSRYTKDQDSDGSPDEIDEDLDGDGLPNKEETQTDPKNPDSDADGSPDGKDPFPSDASEWSDVDEDGQGDNSDADIDGDGISNEADADPSNSSPKAETTQEVVLTGLGEEVQFDASPSADDSGIVKYVWQFGEERVEGAQVSRTFDAKGLQVATLTVYDANGQSDSTEIHVRVFDYAFLVKAVLFALLLVLLAFYTIYRYNRRALLKKTRRPKKKKS